VPSDHQQMNQKSPVVVTEIGAVRQLVRDVRARGKTIGLVPTMGALHEGHMSLVCRAASETDYSIVTIFVNPTQFGPSEDFSRYPRTFDSDLALLARERVDAVFVPSTDQMYPNDFSTLVQPPRVAEPWEGRCRPGHFQGVATIVLKLLNVIPADVAFFGQKDFQQVRVVQDMVRDLNLPIRIEVCPTVRDADGLAMSSRNRYLNATERRQSLALVQSLRRAGELATQGYRDAAELRREMLAVLERAGITRIDYVALVHRETLANVEQVTNETVALVAAFVGGTRLIDNCSLGL